MNAGLFQGFAVTFLAGLVMGGNLLPIKWARIWKWENFWLVYSLVGLLVVPVGLAFFLLPNLGSVYASLSPRAVTLPFLLGAGWGIAQLGSGVCVHRIGFALTASILNGLCAASGTLVPLALQHAEMLFQTTGLLILAGTAVMLVGVAFCGWAGARREETLRQQGSGAGFSSREAAMSQTAISRAGYLATVALAVISGFLAALLNFALAFGGGIVQKVLAEGAKPVWAPFAVWPIALLGGLLVNVGYCLYLLFKNRTWGNFGGGVRELKNPVLAGCMWMGGIAIYSSGTTLLGILGVSVGWALFQISLILCGNAAGLLTGEWRQMEARIQRVHIGGIVFLFLAIGMIAAANYSR